MSSSRVPRFNAYKSASSSASYAKRQNKRKDTRPELLLRKALWDLGARYRLHTSQLPGKPDIVFPKKRIAIFVDGDFWHGRNWNELEQKLKQRANPDYWIAKIQYNITRDRQQTEALVQQGWTVLRFWETDITLNHKRIAQDIVETIRSA